MQPWNKAHGLLSAAQGMTQSSAQWINTPLEIFSYHFSYCWTNHKRIYGLNSERVKTTFKAPSKTEPSVVWTHMPDDKRESFGSSVVLMSPWCHSLILSYTKFNLTDFSTILSTILSIILSRFLSNFSMQAMKGKTFFFSSTQEQIALMIKCLFTCQVVWLIKVTGHEVSEYLCF